MGNTLELAIKEHIACCSNAVNEAIKTSSEQAINIAKDRFKKSQSMLDNPDLFFEEQRLTYLCSPI